MLVDVNDQARVTQAGAYYQTFLLMIASLVAQWEADVGSVLSGRSVWLSAGGGLTLFVAVDQVV
jgi:hypothetical protein